MLPNLEIERFLAAIFSDSFNRALAALEDAGALDTRKLRAEYCGAGSRYYDVVTQQIEHTARDALPGVRALLAHADETPTDAPR